jgi:hypothetical protein
MKSRKPNTTSNAADAYQARASEIARLIDVLQMELEKHATGAKADLKCWGKVGDLGKVRSDLIDLVAFMSSSDREAIENFLSE